MSNNRGELRFDTSRLCQSCRGFGIIGNEYDHEKCPSCDGSGISPGLLAAIEADAVEQAVWASDVSFGGGEPDTLEVNQLTEWINNRRKDMRDE